jgi:hypothetical protein
LRESGPLPKTRGRTDSSSGSSCPWLAQTLQTALKDNETWKEDSPGESEKRRLFHDVTQLALGPVTASPCSIFFGAGVELYRIESPDRKCSTNTHPSERNLRRLLDDVAQLAREVQLALPGHRGRLHELHLPPNRRPNQAHHHPRSGDPLGGFLPVESWRLERKEKRVLMLWGCSDLRT